MFEWLSDWQNFIFVIPIILAFLLMIGTMMGLDIDFGEPDLDIDTDLDTDFDTAHSLLGVLGFGKCPLAIMGITWMILFGGIGIMSNMILEATPLYGFISLGISFVLSTIITSIVARTVGKLMPRTETYNISKYDLISQTGVASTRIDGAGGWADIRDHEGSLHQVRCQSIEKKPIKRGDKVYVHDFMDNDTYKVSKTI